MCVYMHQYATAVAKPLTWLWIYTGNVCNSRHMLSDALMWKEILKSIHLSDVSQVTKRRQHDRSIFLSLSVADLWALYAWWYIIVHNVILLSATGCHEQTLINVYLLTQSVKVQVRGSFFLLRQLIEPSPGVRNAAM